MFGAVQPQSVRKIAHAGSTTLGNTSDDGNRDRVRFESESTCRSILGVSPEATWEDICEAHERLVADMTPGPKADHLRVTLALSMLDEVNLAFASLQRQAVA